MTTRALLSSIFIVLLCGAAGCLDIRNFEGDYSGMVMEEEAIRQGFASGTKVDSLLLRNVDLHSITATMTTSDGKFNSTPLTRVAKYSNDVFSSLTFDGNPVRSFLHFAPLETEKSGCPAMVLISLFGDDHVEARVIRGNDLFGLFRLERKP